MEGLASPPHALTTPERWHARDVPSDPPADAIFAILLALLIQCGIINVRLKTPRGSPGVQFLKDFLRGKCRRDAGYQDHAQGDGEVSHDFPSFLRLKTPPAGVKGHRPAKRQREQVLNYA